MGSRCTTHLRAHPFRAVSHITPPVFSETASWQTRGMWARILCIGCLAGAVACGDDDKHDLGADGAATDGAVTIDAAPPDANPCPRAQRPANGVRYAVVSHPYDADGNQVGDYEVLELSAAGELFRPGITFAMGRSNMGTIAFTHDGEVGVVAQTDGTLGVFRIDDAGAVEVVHAAYAGDFYAETVIPTEDGSHMYVVDPNWRNNGGGIYEITIGCDGSIVGETLVAAAKLSGAMTLRANGEAVLWSDDVIESAAGDDAHLLDLSGTASVVGGADAFGDDDAIIVSSTATADGRFALGGDSNQFSERDNRVAVVEITAGGLTPVQILTPIEDPVAMAASPFDDTVIIASGFGDAVFVVDYAPAESPPFTVRGELSYDGDSPQLPGKLVQIERGDLRGLVLLAENVGVRRIRFEGGGTVTDLGEFSFGSGLENIAGSIGVQP